MAGLNIATQRAITPGEFVSLPSGRCLLCLWATVSWVKGTGPRCRVAAFQSMVAHIVRLRETMCPEWEWVWTGRARSVSGSVFPKTLVFSQRGREIGATSFPLLPQCLRSIRRYPRSASSGVYMVALVRPPSVLWEWTLTQRGILPSAMRSTGTKRPACRIGLTQRKMRLEEMREAWMVP